MQRIRSLLLLTAVTGLLFSTLAVAGDVPSTGNPAGAAENSQQEAAAQPTGFAQATRWMLWPLGVAEVWLLVWLVCWFATLMLAPLRVRQADNWFAQYQIGGLCLPDGAPLTAAHLVIVRAFSAHQRVIDAWVEHHTSAICDWHSIDFDSEHDRSSTASINGLLIDLEDPAQLRAQLGDQPTCLAVFGDSRRWDAQVITALQLQAMHPTSEQGLQKHRVVPVVLDRNSYARIDGDEHVDDGQALCCLAIQGELSRIESIHADVNDSWLRLLISSHRLLPVIRDWSRTPAPLRDAVHSAYLSGELPMLVVMSGGSGIPDFPSMIAITAPELLDEPLPIMKESPEPAAEDCEEVQTVAELSNEPAADRVSEDAHASAAGEAMASSHGSDTAAPTSADSPAVCDSPLQSEAFVEPAPSEPIVANEPDAVVERLADSVRVAVPKLVEAMRSEDELTRRRSARELSDLILATLPVLAESLHDEDVSVRRSVMSTLARAEHVLQPVVTGSVDDTDAEVRRSATMAITRVDENAVQPLASALEDDVAEVRRAAAQALGRLGPMASGAVPMLVSMLDDPCTDCRREAASALGWIGAASTPAAPLLAQLVLEDGRIVRAAASKALGAIGETGPEIIGALCEGVRDSDPAVRTAATRSLGELRAGQPEVVPALRTALRDEFPEIRRLACESLGQLGPMAKGALDDLETLMSDRSVQVRRSVVAALSKIDLAAVPLLTRALEDDDVEVRRIAAAALSGIGLAAVPALISGFNTNSPDEVASAAEPVAADQTSLEVELERWQGDMATREHAVSAVAAQ